MTELAVVLGKTIKKKASWRTWLGLSWNWKEASKVLGQRSVPRSARSIWRREQPRKTTTLRKAGTTGTENSQWKLSILIDKRTYLDSQFTPIKARLFTAARGGASYLPTLIMTTNGKNFVLLTFSWAQIMRICILPANGPWLPRLVSCLSSCMDQPRPCFFNANRWPVAQYPVSYINIMLHAQTGVEEGNGLCMFDFCQRYHSSTS